MWFRVGFAVLFSSLTAASINAQAYRTGVDPRIELMSILSRLAGFNEYNQCRIPSYDKAIDQYFAAYQNHVAVQLVRKLEIDFEGPMSLAVHVKDIETFAERVPLDRPGIRLDERWKKADTRQFLAATRQFVKDTNFVEFLTSQEPLYDATNARLQSFVEHEADLEWYSRFFGARQRVRFVVVPGMANGSPSYGASFVGDDGVEEIYSIPGVEEVGSDGVPNFDIEWRSTMVHEFVHAFTNPLVDKFALQMENAASQINKPVEDEMRSQAYGEWRTLLYESMVRASTIRYVMEHDGRDAAQRLIHKEQARAFYWIDELSNLLAEYQKNRGQYPTLESFMPQIVQFFNGVAPRIGELISHYDGIRPRVVSTNISDGARDVDPGITRLIIRFNGPMVRTRYSLARTAKDETWFPKLGRGEFDETGTVFSVPITLESDHEYQFAIFSFLASETLAPLKTAIHFRFRTKSTAAFKRAPVN